MSKNHKPYDERELQQADATAYALGELSASEAAQFERSKVLEVESSRNADVQAEQTRRLGQLLRADISGEIAGTDSTSGESIRCSTQIRESVLAALDAQESTLPPKLVAPEFSGRRRSRTRIWAWSLVASIAVAIGGMLFLPKVQFIREAARPNGKTQTAQSVDEALIRNSVKPESWASAKEASEKPASAGEGAAIESSLADYDAKLGNERADQNGLAIIDESKSIAGAPIVTKSAPGFSPSQPSAAQMKGRGESLALRPLTPATAATDDGLVQDLYSTPTPQVGGFDAETQTGRVKIGGREVPPNSLILQGQNTDEIKEVLEALAANDQRPESETTEGDKSEALAQHQFGSRGMPSRPLNESKSNADQPVIQSFPDGSGLTTRAATHDRWTEETEKGKSEADRLQEMSSESPPSFRYMAGVELDSDGDGAVGREWVDLDEAGRDGYRDESRNKALEKAKAVFERKQEELRRLARDSANEQYKSIPENPFWRPIGKKAMSTFSIDVDTASYANVRRFLTDGSLPPPDAVRLEEFINYFHYDYPQPEEGSPFAVDLKLFGCPWNAQHSLLRVGLHGREIEATKRPISNIVYLVDVSGSMSDENKLPLLKRGLQMMVDHLSENDTVSIVTYAGEAGVRMDPTNGANKKKILDAIDSLQSGGSTNGAAGIEVAYRLAQQNFVQEGANRVILMTDGDLNVGVTSDESLVTLIKEKAAGGVFLTVLGFGTGNLKDGKLEGLADNGNGIYGYIDSLGEAHKVLVEQMSGNLVTIAKDVKIQIEFNPAQVAGYRLIGYENRVMANADFANDRKDAGEIGAGHTVTALYEIVPVGAMLGVIDTTSTTLKYQTVSPAENVNEPQDKSRMKLTEAASSGELAQVSLRFKTPEGTESRLVEFTAKSEVTSFSQADGDCRFAAAVAAFGMRLRQSPYAGNITFDAIAEIGSAAIGNDSSGHRAEFVDLVRRAKALQSNAGE